METPKQRLPQWLRRELPPVTTLKTNGILDKYGLNTVCESALCPNRTECYSRSTATFMILGNVCTRRCGFCAIETGKAEVVMADEPQRVADAAYELGLKYVVVTSVARDDLVDEGANHFAQTIRAIREKVKDVQIEVLTPDFHARKELIKIVVDAAPEVFNHNIETVKRLQKEVRVQAAYDRTISVIETIKEINPYMPTKSGLMLGLGETDEEIMETCVDLRKAGCDILTLGQYLPPSKDHLPVQRYVSPEEFEAWEQKLKPLGFRNVFSGPYVRSSYHAGEVFIHANNYQSEESVK